MTTIKTTMGIDPANLTPRMRALMENPHVVPPVCEPDAPNTDDEWCDQEIPLHRCILKLCAERGWVVFSGSTAHRTHRKIGEPDLAVHAHGGRRWLIELKSAKGKLSDEQRELHERLAWLGHVVHVVRSVEQFEELTK